MPDSESYAYKLVIPNKEVREVFILQIQEWFKAVVTKDDDTMKLLSKAILDKDEKQIARQLNIVMGRMISILDTKAPDDMKENFYHGLLLGLLRGSNPDWLIKSNRESGDGFSDILIGSSSWNIFALQFVRSHKSSSDQQKFCTNSDLLTTPHSNIVFIAAFSNCGCSNGISSSKGSFLVHFLYDICLRSINTESSLIRSKS